MSTAAIYTYSAMRDQESIRRQREHCEAFARSRGWATVTVTDGAGHRTGLAALLEQASLGDVDAVLAWHIDRFGRRPFDLLRVLDTLDRAGVEVHTVTGGRINATDHYARRLAATTAPVRRPGRRIAHRRRGPPGGRCPDRSRSALRSRRA
ncbi:MAG: recombinase family protein [Haloechinothrix sp.]